MAMVTGGLFSLDEPLQRSLLLDIFGVRGLRDQACYLGYEKLGIEAAVSQSLLPQLWMPVLYFFIVIKIQQWFRLITAIFIDMRILKRRERKI